MMRSAMNLYSPRELAYLYQRAEEQGIGSLEPDDREAVRDYARQHGLPSPRKRNNKPIMDTDLAVKPAPVPEAKHVAEGQTAGAEPTPATATPTVSAAAGVSDSEMGDSELKSMCQSIIWDNIPEPLARRHPQFRANLQATALRKFGKPGIISSNIRLSSAHSASYRINTGRYKAWQPRGAYSAYVARDPHHEGKYCVVARYVGGDSSC